MLYREELIRNGSRTGIGSSPRAYESIEYCPNGTKTRACPPQRPAQIRSTLGFFIALEFSVMAPRAYWGGYLKLSLVSRPIALYPATSEREKISFHQLNKNTGHRIEYRRVDAETGDEVESSDIIKGYEVGKDQYIEINPEEPEAVAIESKRTIDIDEFVPKDEI
jgi:Ku70/Ku80 beta-barrel domain